MSRGRHSPLHTQSPNAVSRHWRCYEKEGLSSDELRSYLKHPVHDPDLWIAVQDKATGQIAASGIAELDTRIGEGVLEWIQVSPEYRRKGLGQYVVRERLFRMKGRAGFVTVSGNVNNPDHPLALYQSCGFTRPVLWHIITPQPGDCLP